MGHSSPASRIGVPARVLRLGLGGVLIALAHLIPAGQHAVWAQGVAQAPTDPPSRDRREQPARPSDKRPPGATTPDGAAPRQGAQGPTTAAKKKPSPPDTPEARAKALANLYAHLATAADAGEASAVASAIEMLWVQSGSDTVSLLLSRATQAIVEKRTDLARELFDAVVDLAPDFAEGFARRAFFHYSENDPSRAIGDLRRALALEPNHYRALDGLATILKEIGEKRASLKALKQLEQVHPNWPGLEEALREMERAVEGQGI